MKISDPLFSDLPNPKQNGIPIVGRHTWYPYYAGYSPIFVQKVLERANLSPTAVVCDPWNGAGTTTQVALDLGYQAVGFDLNPVMVVVARSRLVTPAQIPMLSRNLDEIIGRVPSYRSMEISQSDPLNLWLKPCATLAVRQIESAIQEEFHNVATKSHKAFQPWNVSREIAFFLTAIFRCLFRLSKKLRTSNPTWLKVPRHAHERLSFDADDLKNFLKAETSQMLSSLEKEHLLLQSSRTTTNARLDAASSESLPLENQIIDIVITSPPYCTRIDYAVSTSLELAFLGFDYEILVRKLRDQMIGTSTIRHILPEEDHRWGPTCSQFLSAMRNHSSKASRSYYLKTHLQYFHDIFVSFLELDRVLCRGGDCIVVIQDSFYKDIHTDLPAIMIEMARSIRWETIGRRDFPVRPRVNPLSQHYRPPREAVESVLWFKTPRV
jgi:hypothetical protein